MTSGRIDVHHHFFPPEFLAVAAEDIARDAPSFDQIGGWTAARALDDMDAAGIAVTMLSVPPPVAIMLGDADAARLARQCNDFAARMIADRPKRFGLFAMLPMPHVSATLTEIAYAFDVLGADGAGLLTHYGDQWLGDPLYEPVLAELDRRGAVIHVHPIADKVQPLLPGALLEFPFDTTRAIVNFIATGAAARHARLRPIFSHSGGAMTAVISRIAAFGRFSPVMAQGAPDGVEAMLARFHYDVTFAARASQLAALVEIVPETQLLFGSDAPFLSPVVTIEQLADPSLPAARRAAIERVNARALFPRVGH